MNGLLERGMLLGLAVVAVYVLLVPLDHSADAASRPDVLFCLVLAWAARRRAGTPLVLVLAFGLLADILLARPPGLGALGLVLAAEAVRVRPAQTLAGEWLMAGALFAAILAGTAFLLAFTLAPLPDIAGLARHWLATAIAYPIVAALVALVLRHRTEAAR